MQRKTEKNKNIKQAILVSALSIVLCLTGLFGTTYAWLTDKVIMNASTIEAGAWEVDIQAEGKSLLSKEGGSKIALVFTKVDAGESVQSSESEGTEAGIALALAEIGDEGQNESNDEGSKAVGFWEAGATYQLPALYVVNKGTIDLKYDISIENTIPQIDITDNTAEGVTSNNAVVITDLIDFTILINGEEVSAADNGITSASGAVQLSDNQETTDTDESKPDEIIISGKLKEDVDWSEYLGKQFSQIVIKIAAKQDSDILFSAQTEVIHIAPVENAVYILEPEPTVAPSTAPTSSPEASIAPTATPSTAPTEAPTQAPASSPEASIAPTAMPSTAPTEAPTQAPTSSPEASIAPTAMPSTAPTEAPTQAPTGSPEPTDT